MSDGLLESIIQLEKSIQAEIAREQVRAEEWQARELTDLDAMLHSAGEEAVERRKRLLADRTRELEQESAKIQSDTEAWCKALEALDEALLRTTLRPYLAVILPEGDHDHPHGEG